MVKDNITQLLFNALAQRQTVVLLGIGSLRFRRVAAKLEGSTLTPPRNMFRFSSREEGRSLLDMLVDEAGCTREEGEEAYRRWLHRIKQGHSVVIEGVGRIEDDFFTPSEELERLLNPTSDAPVVLRRHRSLRGLWIGLAAVALVAVAGGAWCYVNMHSAPAPTRVAQTTEKPAAEVVETADSEATESVVEGAAEPVEEVVSVAESAQSPAPENKPVPTPATTEIGEMTSGMSYVVVGVFSTEDNARKFIEQMARRAPEMACRAYKFQGSKFMVSGFESADGAEASAFIRDHRAQFPDLWVYKRK
ncbi:MAG: hypothetical protein IJZ05_06920 [Rikenellaceae bacterium]|nr:hypothetical protein [Rikenellaceae bacterium]